MIDRSGRQSHRPADRKKGLKTMKDLKRGDVFYYYHPADPMLFGATNDRRRIMCLTVDCAVSYEEKRSFFDDWDIAAVDEHDRRSYFNYDYFGRSCFLDADEAIQKLKDDGFFCDGIAYSWRFTK